MTSSSDRTIRIYVGGPRESGPDATLEWSLEDSWQELAAKMVETTLFRDAYGFWFFHFGQVLAPQERKSLAHAIRLVLLDDYDCEPKRYYAGETFDLEEQVAHWENLEQPFALLNTSSADNSWVCGFWNTEATFVLAEVEPTELSNGGLLGAQVDLYVQGALCDWGWSYSYTVFGNGLDVEIHQDENSGPTLRFIGIGETTTPSDVARLDAAVKRWPLHGAESRLMRAWLYYKFRTGPLEWLGAQDNVSARIERFHMYCGVGQWAKISSELRSLNPEPTCEEAAVWLEDIKAAFLEEHTANQHHLAVLRKWEAQRVSESQNQVANSTSWLTRRRATKKARAIQQEVASNERSRERHKEKLRLRWDAVRTAGGGVQPQMLIQTLERVSRGEAVTVDKFGPRLDPAHVEIGTKVTHHTFGPGVITEIHLRNRTANVRFADSTRLLALDVAPLDVLAVDGEDPGSCQ